MKRKARQKNQDQFLRKKIRVQRDPERMGPTEVAAVIGETYQQARNLMLAGAFGKADYDEENRKLSVPRVAVLAYKKDGPR